ncbi:MAG: T9SS type A sorting domain-containing protein [Flavobacteriales bacterium]
MNAILNLNRLALAAVFLCASSVAWGQCDIDFDFGEATFGVSPDPAMGETFLDGMLDESYFDVLHILIPANAAGIDSTYPPTLPVDSVIVLANSVDGAGTFQGIVFTDTVTQEQFFADEIGLEVLFNNNGDSGNPNAFMGGEQYCAAIQGAPNRSGIYRISIDIQAWATIFTPFNAPYTFDNFTLRVNCPLLEDVAVTNVNSDEGTQGTLTATLAEGVEATEVAWFNAFGDQIGTGMSVSVDNPGAFSVQITTADCQSLFGGLLVGDDALECELLATVEVSNTDPNMFNGSATVVVSGAVGAWTANWYSGAGILLGSGEVLSGLGEGAYSVVVSDDSGCTVEVEDINVLTGLDDVSQLNLAAFPNPASSSLFCAGVLPGDTWTVLNLNGATVLEGRSSNHGLTLDVSSLDAGMYIMAVTRQGVRQVLQVQIQH